MIQKNPVTEELQNNVTALTHCVRKQGWHSRHTKMVTMGKKSISIYTDNTSGGFELTITRQE